MKAALVCLLALVLVGAATASRPAPDLSPAAWSAQAIKDMTAGNSYSGRHPTTTNENKVGTVSGTSNLLGVYAGFMALAHGGSAADACVATALSQTVLAAGSYVSMAGIADALYYDGATGEVTSLMGSWGRVEGNPSPTHDPIGRSAYVGGFPRVMADLSARHGRLAFASLLQPAEYFARVGVPRQRLEALDRAALKRTPAGQRLAAQIADKSRVNVTQPEWAALLAAARSADDPAAALLATMYGLDNSTGSWAAQTVAALNAHGGNSTVEDYRRYRSVRGAAASQPLRGAGLRGRLHGAVDPVVTSLGSVELREQMNVVGFSGPAMAARPAYNGTVVGGLVQVHRWSEAMSDLFLAGARYVAGLQKRTPSGIFRPQDTMSLDAFQRRRMQTDYAEAVARLLANATHTNAVIRGLWALERPRPQPSGSHSDSVVAVDAQGSMCVLAHSINSGTMWGTGIFVDGIAVSDGAAGVLNRALNRRTPPGHNLLMPLKPTVVTDPAGRPVVGYSSIGSSLAPVTLQSLVTLVSPRLPASPTATLVADSCNAPHFHLRTVGGTMNPVSINAAMNCSGAPLWCPIMNEITNAASPAFIEALPPWLTEEGLLTVYTGEHRLGHSGIMAAVALDGEEVSACASPAVNGGAIGY